MSNQKTHRLQVYQERLTMIDGDTAIIEDHSVLNQAACIKRQWFCDGKPSG